MALPVIEWVISVLFFSSLAKRGEGRFYHKKAFVFKIPLHPPLPVYDRKRITKGG
jgi:hypothetical protein